MKKEMSRIPLSCVMKPFIMVFRDSAKALVEQFTKMFGTFSYPVLTVSVTDLLSRQWEGRNQSLPPTIYEWKSNPRLLENNKA